jgi:hypothetical protein
LARAKRNQRTARRQAARKQAAREQQAASKRTASERSPSKRPPGTRYRALVTGRVSAVLSLLALFAVNFLWFSTFSFRTIMGDDLGAWSFFTGHPSFSELFLNGSGGKYRPVTNLVQYVLFQAFSGDYRSWVTFNIILNCVVAAVLFLLIRRLAKGDNVIALLGGLLYVTSRFSYYNILQLNGVMEALSLLFLVLIMYVTVRFYEDSRLWPGFALAGLYLLISRASPVPSARPASSRIPQQVVQGEPDGHDVRPICAQYHAQGVRLGLDGTDGDGGPGDRLEPRPSRDVHGFRTRKHGLGQRRT